MFTAIRVELLKFRTTRLWLGLVGAAVGLNALVATVTSSSAGTGSGPVAQPLSASAGLKMVLTSTGFSLVVAMVSGALLATNEFRNQTATDTYLQEPNRRRVLLAKLVAALHMGFLIALVGGAVTAAIALAFVSAKGYALAVPAKTIAGFIAGNALAGGLLAALGVAFGALVRNQIAAVIAVFVWAFGVEQVVGGLSKAVAPFLPYTAAATMAGARAGSGMPQLANGLRALPFVGAAALLAGLAFALTVIANHTTVQKDVT